MTEVGKLSAEQEIRTLALNLAAVVRKADVRFAAGNGPDGLAEQTVRDADMFAEFIDIGTVPPLPGSGDRTEAVIIAARAWQRELGPVTGAKVEHALADAVEQLDLAPSGIQEDGR